MPWQNHFIAMRTRWSLLLCAVLVLAGCGPEPLPDRDVSLASLVAAERAFAQTSVEQGRRTAFLEYLAEGSIIFSPTPTDGRAVYTQRSETPTTLAWQPVFADVAATGDLGYTTGPWTFSDSAGTPVSYGHYVSVWRVQPDSTWRVEIDAGISHPLHETPAPAHVASPNDSTAARALRKLYQESARVALLRTDRELAVASEERGAVEAFRPFLTDSVRIYRPGAFPSMGRAAMEEVLARDVGVLTWRPITAAVSRAGDLGYTYGLATFRAATDDTTAASRTYFRIWKAQPDSVWRIVIDLASPILSEE